MSGEWIARGVTLPTALGIVEELQKPQALRRYKCGEGGQPIIDPEPDEPDTGGAVEQPKGSGQRQQGGGTFKKGGQSRGSTPQQRQNCINSLGGTGSTRVCSTCRFHEPKHYLSIHFTHLYSDTNPCRGRLQQVRCYAVQTIGANVSLALSYPYVQQSDQRTSR